MARLVAWGGGGEGRRGSRGGGKGVEGSKIRNPVSGKGPHSPLLDGLCLHEWGVEPVGPRGTTRTRWRRTRAWSGWTAGCMARAIRVAPGQSGPEGRAVGGKGGSWRGGGSRSPGGGGPSTPSTGIPGGFSGFPYPPRPDAGPLHVSGRKPWHSRTAVWLRLLCQTFQCAVGTFYSVGGVVLRTLGPSLYLGPRHLIGLSSRRLLGDLTDDSPEPQGLRGKSPREPVL